MIKIKENGFSMSSSKVDVEGIQRSLTPVEASYGVSLKHMGFPYEFKHQCYEQVKMQVPKYDFLGNLRNEFVLEKTKKLLENNYEKHNKRLNGHLLQVARNYGDIPKFLSDRYIELQLKTEGMDWVTFIDREEGATTAIADDITNNMEKLKELDKTPRAMINMTNPSYEAFVEKTESALSAGAKSIVFRHASIRSGLEYFDFAFDLSKKGVHTHIFGIERRIRGKKMPPTSYPSIMSLFGFKQMTLRGYGWFEDIAEPISYDDLRIFDEATHGFLNKAQGEQLYGNELETETDLSLIQEIGGRQEAYDLCKQTDLYHPLYAYETVASHYELNKATELIKKKKIDEFVAQKQFLQEATLALKIR